MRYVVAEEIAYRKDNRLFARWQSLLAPFEATSRSSI